MMVAAAAVVGYWQWALDVMQSNCGQMVSYDFASAMRLSATGVSWSHRWWAMRPVLTAVWMRALHLVLKSIRPAFRCSLLRNKNRNEIEMWRVEKRAIDCFFIRRWKCAELDWRQFEIIFLFGFLLTVLRRHTTTHTRAEKEMSESFSSSSLFSFFFRLRDCVVSISSDAHHVDNHFIGKEIEYVFCRKAFRSTRVNANGGGGVCMRTMMNEIEITFGLIALCQWVIGNKYLPYNSFSSSSYLFSWQRRK